jgi:hypothetical protein
MVFSVDRCFSRSFFVLRAACLVAALVFLLPTAVLAVVGTGADVAVVDPANSEKIVVAAPYSDDDNINNTLLVEWGPEDGGVFWPNSQLLSHAASPYAYTIIGLTNHTPYQVRVTYQDADGIASGTAVQAFSNVIPFNPLIHSSLSTESTKWAANGWGVPGGKYGEFTCGTCHAKTTGNVKRVKTALAAPAGPDPFPIEAGLGSVSFLDVRGGSSDFGDDSRLDKTVSDNICEGCHTYDATQAAGVNKHAYNLPADSGHYNKADCTQCHKHSEGFKASGCNGCHGDTTVGNFWPDTASENSADYPDRVGRHVQHVNAIGDAINGGGPASATLTDKNATCIYCHPNPGGTNVDGASHNTDTVGSLASSPDLHKDGFNPATDFINMQGGVDADGTYAANIGRCSTTDCHSNGEFTWTWYTDILAPAQITDLLAATGSEVGTVELTWTAPANDGNAGPNAYQYEVRHSAAPITDVNWGSATIAGGPVSVHRRGNSQSMPVYGLTPGSSYFFAVKTADEVFNWSVASNSVSAAAMADTQAPIFWGLGSAVSTDEAGSVLLHWDAARDHSLPITYTVYYDTGVIDYGGDDQVVTTQGTNFKVTGLSGGVVYNFAVRASDAVTPTPNTDSNTTVLHQLAKTPPKLPQVSVEYFTNGATALQTGTYGATNSGALGTGVSRTWEAPAYVIDTDVYGTNFYARFSNGNENLAGEATAKLGYVTGTTWYDFTPALSMTKAVPPNFNKVIRFGFGGGGMVPAGSKLAVRVTNTGTLSYTLATGSATNRGDIAVAERLYNHLPTAATFSPNPSGSGVVTINWNASTDQDGHTIHYDVYGSDDGGTTYGYVIATNLPEATTSVQWDTVAAGIALGGPNTQIRVKVLSGDGYLAGDLVTDHTVSESPVWTVDNTIDTMAPAAVTDLLAETRPKTGSIYLTWTAPGDDGNEATRASQYDIRYSTADITGDALFTAATEVSGEPEPDFGGQMQGYEVLGLTPGTIYYFAMKTADEQSNWSALSNSATANGGLKCGICHSTPPDDAATAGNHIDHGYTVNDCAKCHGDVVLSYDITHQDGKLLLGFGRDAAGVKLAPVEATITGVNNEIVTYWQDPDGAGPAPAYKIYEDANGAGGFNVTAWAGSDKKDNGTCFNYDKVNASGCHGGATPSWDETVTLPCAACHGDLTRTADPYGRAYDSSSVRVKASPPIDNHGNQGLPTDPIAERKYVGQHEKHLNYSFRFAKGDSCRLCHKDNSHANGAIDIEYDLDGAGTGALFTPNATGPDTPGSCGGTSGLTCHGTAVTPKWDSAENVDCVTCHEFGGVTPAHVTDPAGGIDLADNDPDSGAAMPGNCTWCHLASHPRGVPPNSVLIPNNAFVGINYSGGGIHLRTDIGARGPYTSEAEMCWGCHDSNGISEWGTNTKAATGSSPYDYGTVGGGTSAKWVASPGVGATWVSGTAAFSYKTAAIQSTHTTSPAGSSAVAGTAFNYSEPVDDVTNIRCSNCHDVHNRNLADGDMMSGTPYLRGTWMGNPYPEDGAPQAGTTYTGHTIAMPGHSYANPVIGFGAIPRGGAQYVQQGGYYIDENSGFPTKGWTLESSAGLCTLCHGSDVDIIDQATGETLWLGTNGHSNAVLGGTGVNAENIFDYTHGRPVPDTNAILQSESYTRVPDMGNQRAAEVVGDQYYTYGYRAGGHVAPPTYGNGTEHLDNLAYDWGATVDATTVDKNYHQFSCSKCHNPHASRLPKLMITNCLDIRHNTWDDAKGTQTVSNAAGSTDKNKKIAYFTSAQNCHRRDDSMGTEQLQGGWNKVTPW